MQFGGITQMKTRLILSLAVALMLIATLALPAVALDYGEQDAYVHINSSISITVTDAAVAESGIDFGDVNPGDPDVEDTGIDATTPSANVTVESGTTVDVDLSVRGTDFGSSGLTIGSVKFNITFDPSSGTTQMGTSDQVFANSVSPGDTESIWFWLDVPSTGVTAGSYQSTFTFTASESP
jgi:hypothetical protein